MRSSSILVLSLFVGACSSGASTGGPTNDAGTDSRAPDAHVDAPTREDAAPHADAGAHDGRAADASTVETGIADAGTADASVEASDATDASDASTPDATARDASDSSVVDAGADTGPAGTCGGVTCFVGQSCVAGACQFTDCVGSHVPGDYATVNAAMTALAATGGTVCLGAETYDETVGPGSSELITLQGVGPGQTILTGFSTNLSPVTVAFRGLTVHSISARNPGITNPGVPDTLSITLTEATVDGVGATQPSIELDDFSGTIDLTLDGVDVSASASQTAIHAVLDYGGTFNVSVENSYIHGANVGFLAEAGALGQDYSFVLASFINDTFEGNATAIEDTFTALELGDGLSLTAVNDLFVNNGVAIDVSGASSSGTNCLYGNTTNYAGTAVAGTGTIEANPLLDTSTTPPGLLVGSPCRGAANAAVAPTDDFFGRARGASVDIGAVQSSP